MKQLKNMQLLNVCDSNLTETLFDMASQKKLESLSISMVDENQSLPNFSEALAKFKQLKKLHLGRL